MVTSTRLVSSSSKGPATSFRPSRISCASVASFNPIEDAAKDWLIGTVLIATHKKKNKTNDIKPNL